MKLFAIRHKPTGRYLPAHKPGEGGFSYDDPQPMTCKYGPRLFTTIRGAQNALTAWLRGKFERVREQCGEFGEDESIYVEPKAVLGRKRDNMEIVAFDLVPTQEIS